MELDNNESRRLNTLGFGDRITPSHKSLLKIETLVSQLKKNETRRAYPIFI